MADISSDTAERIKAFYQPNLSIYEIATLAGSDHTTVWRALNVLGLSTLRSYEPDPHPIQPFGPIWAAEFRGFFYADGYAGLKPRGKRPHGTVSPCLTIVQRADGRGLLVDICSKLGGSLYDITDPKLSKESYSNVANPRASWSVYGFSSCLAVIEATGLAESEFPARKVIELKVLYQAICARFSMPRDRLNHDQKALLWECYDMLKELKRFSC